VPHVLSVCEFQQPTQPLWVQFQHWFFNKDIKLLTPYLTRGSAIVEKPHVGVHYTSC